MPLLLIIMIYFTPNFKFIDINLDLIIIMGDTIINIPRIVTRIITTTDSTNAVLFV